MFTAIVCLLLAADVSDSAPHPILMSAAQRHADYQATIGRQGHQGFAARSAALRPAVGHFRFAEICAESWPWQRDCTAEQLWAEAMRCWRQSPGHWSVARRPHRYAGIGMACSRRGIWYVCVIVAD